ncbi:uncharacterized protein pdgfbb [Triplophysa dalaica]|uniref:uncharacterized protein pdgfbb n=1 Tax=Triplophysa dalaica TaxID=1582913 RepID=UPI0024E00CEB|nr:uncharacterized protein pdgfbb [Triplophysa dalaica]XP_056607690.1 uncharacterized protein pdgfbb [Triplophysa dalaica]
MRSRIPLLLAVLAAACLQFGSAEGDPLPAAVVDLVKSGSVSSVQDLQFLLSIEVEPDDHSYNDSSNRLPRSLDAQPAQQAVCKVRTEVIEVTRSMLDRSNTHFMLWPPCVEVQRCSGCCNTKSLQCVPVLTHTRYLQVMKIQYVNKRPLYDKAVVSVLDHVDCRCQPVPRTTQRKKSSTNKQEPRDRSGKSHSKVELHQRDEFKPNQRLSLEDLLSHSWIPKERLHESGPPDAFLPSGDIKLHTGRDGWGLNETQYGGGKGHHHYPVDAQRHHGSTNDTGVTGPLPNHTEKAEIEDVDSLNNLTKAVERERSNAQNNANRSTTNRTTEYKITPTELTNKTLRHQSNLKHEINHTGSKEVDQLQRHNLNFAGTNQTDQIVSESAEKAKQHQGDLFRPLEVNNKTSDVEKREDEKEDDKMSPEQKPKDKEMEDLLLLHKLLEDEEKQKHHLKAQQTNREQDEKLQHLHHKQHTTTQQTGTISPPLQRSPPRTPPRPPPQPPNRRRKQRKRISKSAMRALLM